MKVTNVSTALVTKGLVVLLLGANESGAAVDDDSDDEVLPRAADGTMIASGGPALPL